METPELLPFGNKQENNGVDNRGRLTANEFNQVISAVNTNTTAIHTLSNRLNVMASEEEYEQLQTKDPDGIYFILED